MVQGDNEGIVLACFSLLGAMKLCWHRLGPGEQDYETIFGVLFLTLLLIVSFVVTRIPEEKLPVCRFRAATGIPCPACGITRAVKLFWAGDLWGATTTHPPGTFLLVVGIVYLVYSWVVVIFKLPRIRLDPAN